MRITADLFDQLDRAAKADGRSLSNEAEMRLEQSFHRQHLLDEVFDLTYRDPELVGLLLTMGETMRDTLTATKANDWINDPIAFAEVAFAAQQTIEVYRPLGKPAPNVGQLAVAIVRWTLLKILEAPYGIAAAVRNRIGDETRRRLRARQGSIDEGWITPAREEGGQ